MFPVQYSKQPGGSGTRGNNVPELEVICFYVGGRLLANEPELMQQKPEWL